MKKLLKLLIICYLPLFSMAQMPQISTPGILLKKEIYGGINLATNGWGITLNYAWRKTNKYKQTFGLNVACIKHPKEQKSFFGLFKKYKAYYYGKLNSIIDFRPNYGGKVLLFEKMRENAVEIDFLWATGISLALVKPVYLKVSVLNLKTGTYEDSEQQYDPNTIHQDNILGRSSWVKGLSHSKLQIGLYLKSGFLFDIGTKRDNLWGIELGAQLDLFTKPIPLMYQSKSQFAFPSIYLNIMFGKHFN